MDYFFTDEEIRGLKSETCERIPASHVLEGSILRNFWYGEDMIYLHLRHAINKRKVKTSSDAKTGKISSEHKT